MGHDNLQAAPLVVGIMSVEAQRKRRARRPTLAGVAKQASKAGMVVARYEVEPDGKITVIPGQPEADQTSDLDKWMAGTDILLSFYACVEIGADRRITLGTREPSDASEHVREPENGPR